jgi:hypothetical protein
MPPSIALALQGHLPSVCLDCPFLALLVARCCSFFKKCRLLHEALPATIQQSQPLSLCPTSLFVPGLLCAMTSLSDG